MAVSAGTAILGRHPGYKRDGKRRQAAALPESGRKLCQNVITKPFLSSPKRKSTSAVIILDNIYKKTCFSYISR
jgi:hypothetical protein